MRTATEPAGPLADLRVIDVATVLAGPGCARYLADFGADVIKVERPDGGDTTRSMGWRDPADDVALWWKLEGRGKRTIVLDL
jgi:crotonobetainyl-CoA:carnitine CoA-transferase CaiB-like acyl-CoA transferase